MSAASTATAVAPPALAEAEPTDLRALQLLLRQSRDFRLALALYNDSVRRDGWIRTLADELAPAGVRVLTLDLLQDKDRGRSLLDRVQALAASVPTGQRFSIMVVNVEPLVDYAPELSQPGGPGTAFLESANLHRELFPPACPGPLILWTTELLEQAFIRCAPDLWSWRNHVFDLRTRVVPAAPIADRDGRPLRSDDDRLHPETRLRRLEEELAAYRRTRSRLDELHVLNAIGIARLQAGDAKLANLDFEAALRLARELRDRRWEGIALGNLGLAHAELGDARKAIEFYEQQLAAASEIGYQRGKGNALCNLGIAHFRLGDARKAIEFYEQALVVSRKIKDQSIEGAALGNLGNAHAELGDARKAIEYAEQVLAIMRQIGDRRGESNALGNLGLAYADLGDARKAIGFYAQQLVIVREIGDRRGEGNALFNSAIAHDSLGNRPEAIIQAAAALAIFETIESPAVEIVQAALARWRG